jgi:hypothetical protein
MKDPIKISRITFFSLPSTADAVVSSVKLTTNTVLGGIAYKF